MNRSTSASICAPIATWSTRLSALAGVVSMALVGCQKPPKTLASACVEDWPDSAREFVPAAPLDNVTPALLWRERVTSAAPSEALLLAGDRVAFTAGSRLYSIDRDAVEVDAVASAGRESLTTAVSDADGNMYFVGYSAYSVDAAQRIRWIVPLPKVDGRHTRGRGRAVLGPDGGLFFGADNGQLYAVDTADGTVRWTQPLSEDGERSPIVIGGVGNALMAVSPDGTWKPQLFNRHTGKPMAWFTNDDGERYGVMIGRRLGFVTQRFEDRGGSYPWMHVSVLDSCSAERWSVPATRPQWPVLIGPRDQLYMVERDDVPGSQTAVSVYDVDGTRARGPVDMPIPWGIGADGTIYAVACDSQAHDGPSRLYAYNPDLTERWTLPLGDSCPAGGPLIDEQGRLFFTWRFDGVTEVVAVQTESPGLADTSWPIRRHDVRATGWLE